MRKIDFDKYEIRKEANLLHLRKGVKKGLETICKDVSWVEKLEGEGDPPIRLAPKNNNFLTLLKTMQQLRFSGLFFDAELCLYFREKIPGCDLDADSRTIWLYLGDSSIIVDDGIEGHRFTNKQKHEVYKVLKPYIKTKKKD